MNIKYTVLVAVLLATSQYSEAKRTLSSGRSRGSSSSNTGRRTSSSSGQVTKPAYSNPKPAPNSQHVALSYPSQQSAPKPAVQHASAPSAPQPAQAKPIGWNVPNSKPGESPAVAVNRQGVQSGPPPAYSPRDTPGGARSNPYDAPPAYSPSNQRPPSYPGQTNPVHTNPVGSPPVSGYNPGAVPAGAAAGAAGAGVVHHYHHQVPNKNYGGAGNFSSYPRQSGVNYAQPNMYPQQQQTYHPSNYAPPPAGIPQGYVPQGQQIYQAGAVPAGVYPAGAFPVQQKSSGPGLGTGLILGGLAGAAITHVLTPSHSGGTIIREQAPAPAAAGSPTIIINNGPTGATVEQQPAGGVPQAAGAAAPVPVSAQAAPVQSGAPQQGSTYIPQEPPVPLAPFPANNAYPPADAYGAQPAPGALMPPPPPNEPQPGAPLDASQLIPGQSYVSCYTYNETFVDPNNPENITIVPQTRCDTFVPPPPAEPHPNPSSQYMQPNLEQQPAAPAVAEPTIPTQKPSTAEFAPNSPLKSGSAIVETSFGTMLAILIATFSMF